MTILIIMAVLMCIIIPLSWFVSYRGAFFKGLWEPSVPSVILFLICVTLLIAVGIERFVL